MIWSIFSVLCVIISVVVQDAHVAPASLVLRGNVQLIAYVATQLTTWCAEQLAAVSVNDWRFLRSQLEQHRLIGLSNYVFDVPPRITLLTTESQLL